MNILSKRIFLFLAVNALIVLTISGALSLFGIQPYLAQKGLDLGSLIVFSLVWGMGGAFISLALSRVMAKWMMGVKIVDPHAATSEHQSLVEMVHRLSRDAGLSVMPEVGVYESPDVNAFATGPSKARALVAVSSGLLDRMNQNEIEGVIGHEVAHIANGDMVTMTLIQGIVNAFVMFLARAIAFAISTFGREKSEGGHTNYLIIFVLEIVFMIFGSMVVAWFSRYREYRADAGGAHLAGRNNMRLALEGLKRLMAGTDSPDQPAIQALKISSRSSGMMRLFSTHPPLEDRIRRLSEVAAGTE